MDKKTAEARLKRLLERTDLSAQDKEALKVFLDPQEDTTAVGKRMPQLKLNREASSRRGPKPETLRLCLDFGTAMSKAWATGSDASETLPLIIGKAAGGEGLTVPSSIFISNDGRIFLGQEAERQHRADLRSGRIRFDNLKRMLSEAEVDTELSAFPLRDGIDPTESGLTGGKREEDVLRGINRLGLRHRVNKHHLRA
jgi:hypothetical protein